MARCPSVPPTRDAASKLTHYPSGRWKRSRRCWISRLCQHLLFRWSEERRLFRVRIQARAQRATVRLEGLPKGRRNGPRSVRAAVHGSPSASSRPLNLGAELPRQGRLGCATPGSFQLTHYRLHLVSGGNCGAAGLTGHRVRVHDRWRATTSPRALRPSPLLRSCSALGLQAGLRA